MSLFPFDPIGNFTSNRILNEPHTITEINGADHAYFIPRNAPFYNDSMHVVDTTNSQSLVLGQDYFFVYPFEDASLKTGMAVSGGIGFYDTNRNGTYLLSYQTLGGEYVDEETQAIEDGLETLDKLMYPDWSTLVNVPAVFPPTPHTLRLDHVAGVAGVIAQLDAIAAAVASPERRIMLEDIVDLDTQYINPLFENLTGIKEAIHSLETSRNYYYREATTGNMPKVLAGVPANTWVDTELTLRVDNAGNYLLTVAGNPHVVDSEGARIYGPQVETRFVVDNAYISQSALSSTILGLNQDQVLKLQLRVVNTQTPHSVNIASRDVSCGLAIVKVSN